MASGSPRDTVLSGIIVLVSMSFLTGMFLMVGIHKFVQGDPLYIGSAILIPLMIFAAALHVRRILSVVPQSA